MDNQSQITSAARGLAKAITRDHGARQGETCSKQVDDVAALLEAFGRAIADEVVARLSAQPKVTEKLRDIFARPARQRVDHRCPW